MNVETPTITGSWAWTVAKIALVPTAMAAIVNAWQWAWTLHVPVTVNVTVVNESPYTSAILSYQITNLDTNITVRNWTDGEPVQISPYNTTLLIINTVVPIQRNFTPEHFKLKVKLSQIGQDIEAEATFTVEKGVVQQFYSNVALSSLCLTLVGLAVYSYQQKAEPWKKYLTLEEQKIRKYPKREGKQYRQPKRKRYPERKGKK